MAKLQLLAITTLDGYLSSTGPVSLCGIIRNKYGLTKIRERARLGPDVSFISLTQWKENEGIYFIEAGSGYTSVISSMFRYCWRMKSSLLSHRISKGDGWSSVYEIPGPSSWEMTGNKCFSDPGRYCRFPINGLNNLQIISFRPT